MIILYASVNCLTSCSLLFHEIYVYWYIFILVQHPLTGDAVLAVFPDTTSFYHGRISKPVKQRGAGGELSVQFDEDEDESGCV